MAPFRPPNDRLDIISKRILEALDKASMAEVVNPEEVRHIVRNLMTENLREEYEIEQEVMETLRKHGQKIYEQNADFQKMLYEGKKILAKKKNFTL